MKKILCVDDHEDTSEMLKLLLELSNYEVMTVSTKAEALELALDEQFDLFILDLNLPDESGIELCKQLRDFDKNTPILFYSAVAYKEEQRQALEAGAQAFLIKPDSFEELNQFVDETFQSIP